MKNEYIIRYKAEYKDGKKYDFYLEKYWDCGKFGIVPVLSGDIKNAKRFFSKMLAAAFYKKHLSFRGKLNVKYFIEKAPVLEKA